MRVRALLLLALPVLALGCGSSGSRPTTAAPALPPSPTLAQVIARPGEDSGLSAGTSDYAVGQVRVSFLLITNKAQAIYQPAARVWVGPALNRPASITTTARLEPIGIPGESQAAVGDVSRLYAVTFPIAKPGKYYLVAEPIGGSVHLQAVGEFVVRLRSLSPSLGSPAIRTPSPTLASTHGNLAALTTRVPPDRELVRYSIADSLAAHRPFVLVFATPKFCTSRTCGPVVDVVDAARQRFTGSLLRFIHVEIYRDNDPAKGINRWFASWHLQSEPWTFVVGADGRIKAKFEGSYSLAELVGAIQRTLHLAPR